MAILDAFAEFSDAQAVTATAISNVMDLNSDNTLRGIGTGTPVYLVIKVPVAATAGGAATVTFSLESDSTADLATSPTVHWTSAVVPVATLTAGYRVIAISVPIGKDVERYLGIRFTVATGPLTAGQFDAFLTLDVQEWNAYKVGDEN